MHLGLSIQKIGRLIFPLSLGGDNMFQRIECLCLLACHVLQVECGDLHNHDCWNIK